MNDQQTHHGAAEAETHEHAGHHSHDDHSAHQSHGGHDQADHEDHGGHDHAGHSGHGGHGDHVGQFRRLFWIMLVIAIPVVGFNDMFAHLIGYPLPNADWVRWVSPALGTIMYVWGGRPFLTGGLGAVSYTHLTLPTKRIV